jgi:hypothetical protein
VRQHSDRKPGRRRGHTSPTPVNQCPTVAPVARSHAASHGTIHSGNVSRKTLTTRSGSHAEGPTTNTV